MNLEAAVRELLEICRHKCSPRDEVILSSGKSNHQALLDAAAALEQATEQSVRENSPSSGLVSGIAVIDGQPCCPQCGHTDLIFAFDVSIYGRLDVNAQGRMVSSDCVDHGDPDRHRIFCPECQWYCDGQDAHLDIE